MLVVVGDESGITAGDNAYYLIAFDHRYPGDIVGFGQAQQLGHGGLRTNGDRVFNNTGFVFFHHAHISRLVFLIHALVENADAAFLGHGNGQAVLGDRIHGCRDQRNVQRDVPRQFAFQGHILGQHIGMGGYKQNVVERQCFLHDSEHIAP